MTENRQSLTNRIGVGIGCVLGTGVIALFLLWVLILLLDLMGVLV